MIRDLIGRYNRNRKVIWLVIGLLFVIYTLIHIINNYLGKKLYVEEDKILFSNNDFYKTNYSVVSNEEISRKNNNENSIVIKNFINYCNDGKIEEAYSLISDECKERVFPSIEVFKNNYYNKVFSENKTYNLQLWITGKQKYIYRVELMEDMLATGKHSNEKTIEFFTIIPDSDKKSLNIADFIEKKDLNISNETEQIKINVKSVDIFIHHVDVNIEFENKTDKKILLDRGTKGDSVYLKDTNDRTYASFLFEEIEDNLIINKKTTKQFKIQFDKEYDENIEIKEIGFLDIVLGYDDNRIKQQLIIKVVEK